MAEKPLRVLMLIHRLADNSPYCFWAHEQARALEALGHQVAVIAPVGTLPGQRLLRPGVWAATHATPDRAQVDGIQVRYPRYLTLGEPGVRLLGGRPMALAALPHARDMHRHSPFDIVHAHMLPVEGHAGLLLGRALGIPTALTIHGTDVLHCFRPGNPPWPRNRAVAQDVDVLMAVSSMLADRVSPYRQGPVEIVPNGVDLSLVPAKRGNRRRAILSVGTLKARKCMHTTLDAFSALAAEYPDATLTLCGQGPDRAALEEKIAQRGLGKRATIISGIPHAQMLALMADSDAFVMPSYAEGQGVVYIEAMAAGCVAVGSVGEGIADVIRDGETGYLVPAADTAALIPVLRRILEGGEAVEAVRKRGTQAVQALTWERNAQRCAELYGRAIAAYKVRQAAGRDR